MKTAIADACSANVIKIDDMIADATAYLATLKTARAAWASGNWDAGEAATYAARAVEPNHSDDFEVVLSDPC